MSVGAIDAAVDHMVATYPAICQPVTLPENSVEGRPVKAIKVANGTGARTGVLFLGGTHARELINPETVVTFALRLCDAYTNNTGLTFGPKAYAAATIKMLVNALDIFFVPMVNPDGRHFCLTSGDPWWRKNRSNHPGLPCRGVDLNRNYDILWSSGIGTSSNSCSEIFKGPAAFSEPETRNIRWMIDNFPDIACLVDIHSYSELVLFPWGHDENQTTDPNQNFQNPAFDGLRGTPGGYREFMPAGDLNAYIAASERVRDGIAAVRGRVYTAQQSIFLYPTSATTHDYAYARYFIDTGRRRILGFTVETAREFQPADAEKDNVISEVSAGMVEFLLETLCPAEVVQALLDAIFPLQAMRMFRDRQMLTTPAGQRYHAMFRAHALRLVDLAQTSKAAREAGGTILRIAAKFLTEKGSVSSKRITREDVEQVERALRSLRKEADRPLRADIDTALADLRKVEGKPLMAAFKSLANGGPGPKPRQPKVAAKPKPKGKGSKKTS
jgi:murein tripeptide amidase MpaA